MNGLFMGGLSTMDEPLRSPGLAPAWGFSFGVPRLLAIKVDSRMSTAAKLAKAPRTTPAMESFPTVEEISHGDGEADAGEGMPIAMARMASYTDALRTEPSVLQLSSVQVYT
jgi:hypothetical protein